MKRIEILVLVSLIFSVILSNVLIFISQYDKIKNNVVRVHILANSDSSQDQLLKYNVKDDIYLTISKLLKNIKTKDEAKQVISNNLNYISQISDNRIRKEGFSYRTNVLLTKSYFPTRKYDSFTLPAGYYDALKVVIGEGKGHNWWCVAFPPMCSPADIDEKEVVDILGEDQLKMINKPCEYKFAIVEFVVGLKEKFQNLGKGI